MVDIHCSYILQAMVCVIEVFYSQVDLNVKGSLVDGRGGRLSCGDSRG